MSRENVQAGSDTRLRIVSDTERSQGDPELHLPGVRARGTRGADKPATGPKHPERNLLRQEITGRRKQRRSAMRTRMNKPALLLSLLALGALGLVACGGDDDDVRRSVRDRHHDGGEQAPRIPRRRPDTTAKSSSACT